eukprot:gene43177-37576_t
MRVPAEGRVRGAVVGAVQLPPLPQQDAKVHAAELEGEMRELRTRVEELQKQLAQREEKEKADGEAAAGRERDFETRINEFTTRVTAGVVMGDGV